MQSIKLSLLSLLILFTLCGAGKKTKTIHKKKTALERLTPELKKHLKKINSKYDKKRFAEFLTGEIEKPLQVNREIVEDIITSGLRHLGRKYIFGKLDCSSFIFKSFKSNNISFPYTAESQSRFGKIISDRSKMERGDLIFFTRTYRTRWFVSHVGIYLGNNLMLHAASDIVKITRFPKPGYWWEKYFIFATRLIKEETDQDENK